MAVGTFSFYNQFKHYVADGTIDMNTNGFYLMLYTSAANAQTATLSIATQLTGQVVSANGYTLGGQKLSSLVWTAGTSAGQQKWSWASMVWSANGGSISNIKTMVVKNSAGKLVGYCQLSTSQFAVTAGNRITIAPAATGIFTLA